MKVLWHEVNEREDRTKRGPIAAGRKWYEWPETELQFQYSLAAGSAVNSERYSKGKTTFSSNPTLGGIKNK